MNFSKNSWKKPISFSNWVVEQWSGRVVLTNEKRPCLNSCTKCSCRVMKISKKFNQGLPTTKTTTTSIKKRFQVSCHVHRCQFRCNTRQENWIIIFGIQLMQKKTFSFLKRQQIVWHQSPFKHVYEIMVLSSLIERLTRSVHQSNGGSGCL